jgi:DNA mismatch repair protein MutL
LGSLRSKFLTTDLVARGSVPQQGAADDQDEIARSTPATSELFDWAKRQLGSPPQPEGSLAFERPDSETASDPLQLHPFTLPTDSADRGAAAHSPPIVRQDHTSSPSPRALQIHNRYLVVENEVGLEVIDQHALHERILYEMLREKVLAGVLESQRLLVPEPVDLAADEASAVLENRELLGRLGLEVEPFGGETVLVSAYPAMLANFSPGEVLHGLAEQLENEGKRPEARDLLDELMHMIACKAAVKFGDRLTPEEVATLLEQRHLAQDHHHCPHGRPTALVFTREQLDRQFKRI